VLDAKAVIVGSPTLNNNLFPTVSDFLTYMQGLKPLDKIGAAFGSYGWSGEAPKMITAALEKMNFDIVEPIRHQYIPDDDALEASFELGRAVGRAINEKVAE
jgi:flavorubredoxin